MFKSRIKNLLAVTVLAVLIIPLTTHSASIQWNKTFGETIETYSDYLTAQSSADQYFELEDIHTVVNYEANITRVSDGSPINNGDTVDVGEQILISAKPHESSDVSWYQFWGVQNVINGQWIDNAGPPASISCTDYADTKDGVDFYGPLSVNPPELSIGNDDSLVCGDFDPGQNGYVCSFEKGGSISPSLRFGETFGKIYLREQGPGAQICHSPNNNEPLNVLKDGRRVEDIRILDFDNSGTNDLLFNQYSRLFHFAAKIIPDEFRGLSFETATNGYSFGAGDLDGNSFVDLFVPSGGQADSSKHLNTDGVVSTDIYLNSMSDDGAEETEIIDMDGDGDEDVFIKGDGGSRYWILSAAGFGDGNVNIVKNNEKDLTESTSQTRVDTDLADFDEDGHLDVIAARSHADDGLWKDALGIFYGDTGAPAGQIRFDNEVFFDNQDIQTDSISAVTTGDIDKDGHVDAVIVSSDRMSGNDKDVSVLRGDGNGNLTIDQEFGGCGILCDRFSRATLETVDINNDTWLDVVGLGQSALAPYTSKIFVYLNDGSGQLEVVATEYDIQPRTRVMEIGDLDNDGSLDIATGTYNTDTETPHPRIYVMYNNGNGTFGTPEEFDTAFQIVIPEQDVSFSFNVYEPPLMCEYDPVIVVDLGLIDCRQADNVCTANPGETSPYALGTGTGADPYVLCNANQFDNIGDGNIEGSTHPYTPGAGQTAAMQASFCLGADLDSGISRPIGTARLMDDDLTGVAQFGGVFDGNGHTISNISLNPNEEKQPLGLIRFTDNATVQNIGLVDLELKRGSDVFKSSGGLIGLAVRTTIENVYVTGHIYMEQSGDFASAGGLVGKSGTDTTITDSYADVAMGKSTLNTGGLVGSANGTTIQRSYSGGNIHGNSHVGGLIGESSGNNHIIQSFSTMDIRGGQRIGGLMGDGNSTDSITDSFFSGSLSGNRQLGGISGSSIGNIVGSYSTADITGWGNPGDIAGIVAGNSHVERSFFTGSIGHMVPGGRIVDSAGIMGANCSASGGGSISDSYSTMDFSPLDPTAENSSGGISGLLVKMAVGCTVENSYAAGDIATNNGAIAGLVSEITGGIISNSFFAGDIVGFDNTPSVGLTLGGIYGGWSSHRHLRHRG